MTGSLIILQINNNEHMLMAWCLNHCPCPVESPKDHYWDSFQIAIAPVFFFSRPTSFHLFFYNYLVCMQGTLDVCMYMKYSLHFNIVLGTSICNFYHATGRILLL